MASASPVRAQAEVLRPGEGENWAWQDLDGNVHVESALYRVEISAQTGAVTFLDPNGQYLLDMDCVVVDSNMVEVPRAGLAADVTLVVDGDTATAAISQSSPLVGFATTFDFRRYDGLVRCHEQLSYATDTWIREEKLLLKDQRLMLQDDDDESDYVYAYIDGSKRQRKEFVLTEVPACASVRAFVGWREDDGDSRFDSRLLMSVNGHDYDLTPLLTFPESAAGPTNWIGQSIDPNHLQVGINQITFRISPRIGTEYTYLGLDMDTDRDRSAFSTNYGQTWSYDDLSSVSGQQNGEYMVRLVVNGTYAGDMVDSWDGSRSALICGASAYMTRYSPRVMRVGFMVSDTKLSIYGDRLGASGVEGMVYDGRALTAYLYNQAHNGIDCVVDPATGEVIDPVNYTEYQFNNAARSCGTVSEGTAILVFGPQPTLLASKSRWPRNYQAAWTLGDDTDSSTAATKRAVYYGTSDVNSPDYGKKGFVGHNLKTTVTCWWQPGPKGVQDNNDHRAVITDLYNRGFEVGLHTATDWPDTSTTTAGALSAFTSLYQTYNWIEHAPYACKPLSYCNRESILCWGKIKPSPPPNPPPQGSPQSKDGGMYEPPGGQNYYLVDILEASPIKYLAEASLGMLYGAPNGLFTSPRCLPHYSSYVDDSASPKRLMMYGRYGRTWDKCVMPSKIDEVINRHDVFIGYSHVGYSGDGWFDPGTNRIRNQVESCLVHIADHQDAGELWVEPIYRILDWMVDLEGVTITQQSNVDNQLQISITNALDKPVSGVTLIATDSISQATIDGAHQIYVDGRSVVLPELGPAETKEMVITAGEYLTSLPRLTKVDTDVKVLQAEYSAVLNSATIRAVWTGAGLSENRRFAVACGNWRCLLARHGDLLFANVSHGALIGSDPAYAVEYDAQTGVLSFTIPSLVEEQTITLRPCKDQSVDADFDQDMDIDLDDFGHLQACFSGSENAQTDPTCQDALLDADSDVDVDDLAVFDSCYSGPFMPARRECTSR